MKDKIAVGIDFGGTKIKTAVINERGRILGSPIIVATQNERPGHDIITSMEETIYSAMESAGCSTSDISGIGIGSPGPLDLKNGIILTPPNLATLHNFPLMSTLQKSFHLPVQINNDANCFVLGEAVWGAAKNADLVCGFTLGTGLGCGIVIKKTIFTGATGTAAEIWNSPYQDSNFEEHGAARGVEKKYHDLTGRDLSSLEIYKKANDREPNALRAWKEYGKDLGKISAIFVNFLDPDVLVIGGSVSNAYEYFFDDFIKYLHKHINPLPINHLQVAKASLGNDAGVLGAAAQIFHTSRNTE